MSPKRVMSRLFMLLITSFAVCPLFAGSTGTTQLITPQGSGAVTTNGDYVSASTGALNTSYKFFVEVPPSLPRLVVDIFDADIGAGGANEATAGRDRDRNGFNTTATYSIVNPNGATRTPLFTTGSTTLPAGGDNAWLSLFDSTGDNFRDNFTTNAYNNSDGSAPWSTNWIETNDDGSATTGLIQVTGGTLRIRDDGAGGVSTIEREANLSGVSSATLSFTFSTANVEATDQMRVQVSSNGGGSWSTLETFTGAFAAGSTRSYDISPYIASNTRVRFIEVSGYTGTDSFVVDNFDIKENQILSGHWEVIVDMSSTATAGDDINAFGIRAHDGTSGAGGTELNVYADSILPIGANPPASGTNSRSYTLYPYVTSGCTCGSNDFDYDSNSGTVGSLSYSSRSNAFTQTFGSTSLSGNDTWARNSLSGWTSDGRSTDYGIWSLGATITTYVVGGTPNGNYTDLYVSNSLAAANPPTANPQTNALRLYFATDAGTAPLKPYLEQMIARGSGIPTVGQTKPVTVTVRLVNPTAYPITFSASNLVTTNVPGNGAVYGGAAQVSQGTIVSQPAVGGTGNVTWNPGTVAAGATVLLAYTVNATPTTAGQRIPVTGTPFSGNGTRAKFVDETGNTTQTRATYTLGPLCEVAVNEGLITPAVVSNFQAAVRGGKTLLQWTTSSELGTAGFNVLRLDAATATVTRVNENFLPAVGGNGEGATYRLVDERGDASVTYLVEEITTQGESLRYGPFVIDDTSKPEAPANGATFTREPRTRQPQSPHKSAAQHKAHPVAVIAGVDGDGVVAISAADIAAQLGKPLNQVLKAIGDRNVSVTTGADHVAWTASTDGASILFVGQKPDSIYSAERTYRIELARGTFMSSAPVSPANAPLTVFKTKLNIETDRFAATALPLDPESDYWFWDFLIGGDPAYSRKAFAVEVPHVASAEGARLQIRLQGAYAATTHHASVAVNGAPLGDVIWNGLDAKTAELEVPSATLVDGANEIEVSSILDSGTFDIFYVDGFELAYSKSAIASDGSLDITLSAPSSVNASGFATTPLVLDTTNPLRPVVLQGAAFSGGSVSLAAPSSSLLLAESRAFRTPSSLRGSEDAAFSARTRADLVIIAPSSMHAAADALANFHEREGLRSFVADLDQIYDRFSAGATTPNAIRAFISSTGAWDRPPRYIVLAGDGTFDYRGINTDPGLIPPLMTSTPGGIFASDSLLADRDGDMIPDVAIGRIPAAMPEELGAYVAKLEANSRAAKPYGTIVLAADAQDRGADFRASSESAAVPFNALPLFRAYAGDVGAVVARDSLMNNWRAGSPLVSWMGHGGLDRLSASSILTSADAPSLTSTGVLPFLVAMTCTINRFELGYVGSLGSALTTASSAGAIGVWSATGLSMHADAAQMEKTFFQLAARTPGARIGDLILQTLAGNRDATGTSRLYLLLGDPAAKLNLPDAVATAGGSPQPGE